MGKYVNPLGGMSKEMWLIQHGDMLEEVPTEYKVGDCLVVCWVDNGAFSAAGIADSQAELEAFKIASDTRQKLWFLVPEASLKEFMG